MAQWRLRESRDLSLLALSPAPLLCVTWSRTRPLMMLEQGSVSGLSSEDETLAPAREGREGTCLPPRHQGGGDL